MTSAPVRDPLADHLLTPENAAFQFIGYQPSQLATIRSMDPALLLKNAVDCYPEGSVILSQLGVIGNLSSALE
jgi:hypothetical protein